ncbi:MAG: hypothetical protein LBS45_11975 [Synergistaceae bacterium]|nr:hypothetical protein [Synergistaceae bacterium]
MANNVSIRFEKGVFRISAEIPVTRARETIESIVGELNSQLLGEDQFVTGQTVKVAPKMLDEKEAAKYIGRSVSFLRTCRYKAKRGELNAGPKYIRLRNKFIAYPVKDLDDWLNHNQRFSTCFEEKVYAEGRRVVTLPGLSGESEVISDA